MSLLSEYILPDEIGHCQIRFADFGSIHRYIYSKNASFLLPIQIPISEIKTAQFQEYSKRFENELLYEIDAPQQIATNKLKEKLFLNQQISKEYEWLMGFSSTITHCNSEFASLHKYFEVYAIIEKNSNSVFFVVVSVFPERDAPLILEYINNLRSSFQIEGLPFQLSMPELDTKELSISNVLHLFSFSADNLIDYIREDFKKFKWRIYLKNEVYFTEKIKKRNETLGQIVLCEGSDRKILQNLNFPNIVFSDEHNSASIFQNVKSGKIRCMRDKDFLTEEEVRKLKARFPKYHILNYYCIENYLYHPDNIRAFFGKSYDTKNYILNIIEEKNKNLKKTIDKIVAARDTYLELKEYNFKQKAIGDQLVVEELSSNEFTSFYKHYDMKTHSGSFLHSINLKKNQLAKTDWFKHQINRVISENIK